MAEEPAEVPPAPPPLTSPKATPEAQAMAAVAGAVTGPGTPAAATVTSKPDKWATIMLMGAGPAVSLMIGGIIGAVVFLLWPDAVKLKAIGVMTDMVRVLGVTAFSLVAILGVVVFRLASGGLKKVEAKAGPAGITIDTGG